MKIDIQKERETPLLGRKRITAVIENEGPTPSRLDLQDALAKQLKAKRDLVIIKHVYSRFGEQNVKVIAHVYDKPENLSVVENKYVQKKHERPEEEKPAEPAPAADAPAPAEEKPAEE